MKKTAWLLLCILLGFSWARAQTRKSESMVTIAGESYYVHTVEPGETLYSLGKAYGTDEQAIRRNNPHTAEGLKTGQVLKIPVVRQEPQKPLSERKKKRLFEIHTVNQGETAYSISKRYGVGLDVLMEDNEGFDPTHLSIGQQINIRKSSVGSSDHAEIKEQIESSKDALNSVSDRFTHHMVARGETLYSLGKRYGLPVDSIVRYNEANLRDGLKVGSILRIPVAPQSGYPSESDPHAGIPGTGPVFPTDTPPLPDATAGERPVKRFDANARRYASPCCCRCRPTGLRTDSFSNSTRGSVRAERSERQRRIRPARPVRHGPFGNRNANPAATSRTQGGRPDRRPRLRRDFHAGSRFRRPVRHPGRISARRDRERRSFAVVPSGSRCGIETRTISGDCSRTRTTWSSYRPPKQHGVPTGNTAFAARNRPPAALRQGHGRKRAGKRLERRQGERDRRAVIGRNDDRRHSGLYQLDPEQSDRAQRPQPFDPRRRFVALGPVPPTSRKPPFQTEPALRHLSTTPTGAISELNFDRRYIADFGSIPSLYAYRGYDVTKLFVGTVKLHGSDFVRYLNEAELPLLQTLTASLQEAPRP